MGRQIEKEKQRFYCEQIIFSKLPWRTVMVRPCRTKDANDSSEGNNSQGDGIG
jgi:hypothetical protein